MVTEFVPDVRTILAIMTGFALAVLIGATNLLRHGRSVRLWSWHLVWSCSVLLEIANFWLWSGELRGHVTPGFAAYALQMSHILALLFMAALLFPAHSVEAVDYERLFQRSRRWFFLSYAFALVFGMSIALLGTAPAPAKTVIAVRTAVGLLLCVVGSLTHNRRILKWLAVFNLVFVALWVFLSGNHILNAGIASAATNWFAK